MLKLRLILVLLVVTCFSLAIYLQPRQSELVDKAGQSGGFLALAFGDGRKLFANEIFAKADAYFHRGNYPSVFDLNAQKERQEENHMSEASHEPESHSEKGGGDHAEPEHQVETHLPSLDWIERFGQNFRPVVHVHLEKGEEREMLPWLQLSAELDPHNVETYTVAAYWLRDRLDKVDEAEQFLREGLQNNPNSPEILNELARLYYQNRKDLTRARNLWVVALRRWHEVEEPKEQPDKLLAERILAGLISVENDAGHHDKAIEYLKQLKVVSPRPDDIQRRIDELSGKIKTAPGS